MRALDGLRKRCQKRGTRIKVRPLPATPAGAGLLAAQQRRQLRDKTNQMSMPPGGLCGSVVRLALDLAESCQIFYRVRYELLEGLNLPGNCLPVSGRPQPRATQDRGRA
jgi:hypothetical protein